MFEKGATRMINFSWDIFRMTGNLNAYLLYKAIQTDRTVDTFTHEEQQQQEDFLAMVSDRVTY